VKCRLPGEKWAKKWLKIMDTHDAIFNEEGIGNPLSAGNEIELHGRSVFLFRKVE